MLIKNAFIVRFFKKDLAIVNDRTLFNPEKNAYVDMTIQASERVRLSEFVDRLNEQPAIIPALFEIENGIASKLVAHFIYDTVFDLVHCVIPEPETGPVKIMSVPLDVFKRLVRRLND